jgi:hypothetical protein
MSILAWLKRLMRRRLDDDDFQEEIRAHLAIAADERVADGADRQTARLASLKDFGNVTLTTEAARRVWTPWWLDAVHDYASDVRYAIRALAKHPTFRRLHDGQRPRAQPARGGGRVGAAHGHVW